jgi:TfoX/Sxy family transcriptional regulator of competence genes
MASGANKWQKSSAELVSRFDACLPSAAGVERRQMFGYPGAFVNGNLFAGLHEQRLVLRLSEAERARLQQQPNAGPFTVMGRSMREYAAITDALERSRRTMSLHGCARRSLLRRRCPPKPRSLLAPRPKRLLKGRRRKQRRSVPVARRAMSATLSAQVASRLRFTIQVRGYL